MTDAQKVAAIRELDQAATHATKVANGMTRGTEKAADERLRKAMQRIATDWIGRTMTDRELYELPRTK